MKCPSISIIIPTLNSQRTLGLCLKSIAMQDYPHDLLEVIIADGGSVDSTLSIVKDFQSSSHIKTYIYENRLKTGEAGKAVGVREAQKELVALIDSDNILPNMQWLSLVTVNIWVSSKKGFRNSASISMSISQATLKNMKNWRG